MPELEIFAADTVEILDADRLLRQSHALASIALLGAGGNDVEIEYSDPAEAPLVRIQETEAQAEVDLMIADREGLLCCVVRTVPYSDDEFAADAFLLVDGRTLEPTSNRIVVERWGNHETGDIRHTSMQVAPLLLGADTLTSQVQRAAVDILDEARIRQQVGAIAGAAAIRLLTHEKVTAYLLHSDSPLVSINGLGLGGDVRLIAAGRSGVMAALIESEPSASMQDADDRPWGSVFSMARGDIPPVNGYVVSAASPQTGQDIIASPIDALAALTPR